MDTAFLYRRFEAAARDRPHQPAAVTADGEEITYRRLRLLVDELTRTIEASRQPAHDCLVVEAGRSARHLAAMLAGWRVGLAYVPLRAHEPPGRRREILDQLAGRAVLVGAAGAGAVGGAPRGPRLAWAPGEAAYVVFTSGSTGAPKGVALPTSALANRVDWSQRQYPLRPADRILQHTAPTFDFSIWEAAASLTHGATLLLVPDEPYTDIEEAVEFGIAHRATVAHFVPSVLATVHAAGLLASWPSLRLLYAGGEQLTGALAARVRASTPAMLVNQYGPAETCVDSTHHPVTGVTDAAAVPIGRPIDNTECRIVEDELLIAGAGLALGYLAPDHPATARFTTLPDSPLRWFRTGDMVTVDAEGNLVFRGRTDDQVKIGGVRVELAQIEALATGHAGVRVAIAVVDEDGGHAIDLLVEARTPDLDPAGLRAHLADHLEGPAMPRRIHVVPTIPRLASGKIDRMRARLAMRRKAAQ
ncbi:amino acid adenylation domain-containing protein [Gandjariella thermophila]|uniref:AMP-dependent synthetase/ligase domain-containing protein n=1 Tax=Gandjariella thermophila TaxID=1931992 RepID=A0A4D4J6L6_9PSEU|nr:amino acid adenylation domain-containing protein [Gandjariella thermophila]GDY29607.1 hypothetical protein GTS_12400 [Gandjariella thermophila]